MNSSEMSHLSSTFSSGKIALANLAQYRAAHTYGFSLKKAVRKGLVRISRELGTSNLIVVKVARLESRLVA